MKIEVKKVDDLRRELRFEIPKERVSKKLNDVYEDIGKVAKIKGYRPGKAPRHVLEMHHSKLAQQETIEKLIPEVYQEGIAKEKIVPMDMPEIHDVTFEGGVVRFTAKLDIRPEIKVKDYKGIKVVRKSSQVTDEEVEKTLEYFKKGQGDDKSVSLDDSFARGLGYPSLADFKKFITRQLEMDKDRQNHVDVENQIVEHLLKNTKFAVPHSLIHRQVHRRMEEVQKRLKSQGMSDEDIKKREDELHKDLEKSVEKDIRVYLIFEKITELEGMTFKEGESMPHKVMELLLKEAKWEEK